MSEHPENAPHTFACLIVEDEAGYASLLSKVVRAGGGTVTHCGSLAEARAAVAGQSFDLLLLDNHLPDGTIYDFFEELTRRQPEAIAIMITGQPDLTEAIRLTRNGLFDYLTKAMDVQALEACLHRARLRMRSRESQRIPELDFAASPAMHLVREQLEQAARHPAATVLLTGESGVGKDLASRVLHRLTFQGQAERTPYVAINCAALPAEMFEAELFGAERGAYTGADRRRPGLAASAQQGTLFLDEIAEIPIGLQAKLLRFLEEREFRSLGSTETQRFRGRVVAATNRDLRAEVAAGRFREDLLFRVEVLSIAVPPLRERRSEIPGLAEQVLAQVADRYGREAPLLDPQDLAALRQYSFPGNVRELRNILERSLLRTPPSTRWLALDRSWMGIAPAPAATPSVPSAPKQPLAAAPAPDAPLPPDRAHLTPFEEQEYRLVRTALVEARGGIRRAAAKLGLSPQALLRRLEKWPELRVS